MQRNVVRGVSLPKELNRLLVMQARKEQRPISTVIQRALQRYLAAEGAFFLSEMSAPEDIMTSGDDGT